MVRRRCEVIGLLLLVFLTALEVVWSEGTQPYVTHIWPTSGSVWGGTLLTIYGNGFANDQFNYGNGRAHLGNKVNMTSGTQPYECSMHKDGSKEDMITCYTSKMAKNTYTISVSVNGVPVNEEKLCSGNTNKCKFTTTDWHTPILKSVTPTSGTTGDIVTVRGKLMTDSYTTDQPGASGSNERTPRLVRTFLGSDTCELTKEGDKYDVALDANSRWGTLKCSQKALDVGYMNASFLVSAYYGRSKPELESLKVSGSGRIYMYQGYATITGISPSKGSTEGGTKVTISGTNFDKDYKIMIGGTECVVQGEIEINKTVCITKPQRAATPEMYEGNRGLLFEIWDGDTGKVALDDFDTLETNDTGYSASRLDSAVFTDDQGRQNFNFRASGFFVAPQTADFRLYVLGHEEIRLYLSEDENPSKKKLIASATRKSKIEETSPQQSDIISMVAGKRYYIEVLANEGTGKANFRLAARSYTSKVTASMTAAAWDEIQQIDVSTTVLKEIQQVVLKEPSTQTQRAEVILVQVNNNENAKFRVGVQDVYTELLTYDSSEENVKTALSALPPLTEDTVTVTSSTVGQTTQFTITIMTNKGVFPDFTSKCHAPLESDCGITISRQTKGLSPLTTFSLSMYGLNSPQIPINADAATVKEALLTLFGVRCPTAFTNPPNRFTSSADVEDFEVSVHARYGTRMSEELPFCGRFSSHNPTYLHLKSNRVLRLVTFKILCFAFRGSLKHLNLKFTSVNPEDKEKKRNTNSINFFKTSDEDPEGKRNADEWYYKCIDIYEIATSAKRGQDDYQLEHIMIYRTTDNSDLYVDSVVILKAVVFGDEDLDNNGVKLRRLRQVKPNDAFIRGVDVKKNADRNYTITMDPHDCGFNFPLLSLGYSQTGDNTGANSNEATFKIDNKLEATITRVVKATPPVTGTFQINFKEETTQALDAQAKEGEVQNQMMNLKAAGNIKVVRDGDCANYKHTMTFLSKSGDQPEITVVDNLEGNGKSVTVRTLRDGSVWYDEIMGDILRTPHKNPQVTAEFNGMSSLCVGDCTFEWSDDVTPTVTGVSTVGGGTRKKRSTAPSGSKQQATQIQIVGTGFSDDPADIVVTINDVECEVVPPSTTTTIKCKIGEAPSGVYTVVVTITGKGNSKSSQTFRYTGGITNVEPTTGGHAGGTSLTVSGFGFHKDAQVQLDGLECPKIDNSTAKIICFTPAAASESTTSVSVTVMNNGETLSTGTQFTYNRASTPIVTYLEPRTSLVTGGSEFTIKGSRFGDSPHPTRPITLGGTAVTVKNYTDTEIVAIFPPNQQGSYKIMLPVGNIGIADTSGVGEIVYSLSIFNVTPARGSVFGGTRLTITGVGFPAKISDAEVSIGDHACHIQNITSTMIDCITADTRKLHEVKNTGSHQEYGPGYMFSPVVTTIPVGNSVRFSWAVPAGVHGIKYKVYQTVSGSNDEAKSGGFDSGEATADGSFTHFFSEVGTFYYSSGFVDPNNAISLKGKVVVTPRPSYADILTVKVGSFDAIHSKTGVSPEDTSPCTPTLDPISGCGTPEPSDKDPSKLNFKFWTCVSPVIKSVSLTNGTTTDVIEITGTGFSSTECQNEVEIGQAKGKIKEASAIKITATVDDSNMPPVGRLDRVRVRVNNLGYAVGDFQYSLIPGVTGMNPTGGSLAGGTRVTITGTGFVDKMSSVDMEGYTCEIVRVTYTEIVCITKKGPSGHTKVTVKVTVGMNDIHAVWTGNNEFNYDVEKTPTVTSVTPDTVSGASTLLTVTGTGFGSIQTAVTAEVAGSICTLQSFAPNTSFTCNVGNVPVGTHPVDVLVDGIGYANHEVTVTSNATASDINPKKGSRHGYLTVTISGNGFVKDKTTVKFGDKQCDVTGVTPSEVNCTTPANNVGDVDVVVTVETVNYPKLTFTYSEAETPNLQSFSPNKGKEGEKITATGEGFSTSPSENTLLVNGVPVLASSATNTQADFLLENLPTGEYDDAKVIVAGKGATQSLTFTFDVGIADITPDKGTTGGQQRVTITGQGFDTNKTKVEICDKECTVVESPDQSPSTYICLTAASDVTTTCTVTVTVNGLSAALHNAYTYDASITPVVTDVNPKRAGTGGGVRVTISGSRFGNTPEEVSVTIGGIDCPVDNVTDEQVICITEKSHSQKTKVNVEVNGKGIATAGGDRNEFHYIDVWSSNFTWGGQSPPIKGDFVVVPKGQILMLDTSTPVLKMLLIQGGELIFDEVDLTLRAENILITDNGRLTVGTEENPFQHQATIEMHGNLRSPELPIYGAKTLGVREGTLDLHGKPRNVIWTVLDKTAKVGDTSITLQDAVDWTAGDEIVIATTGGKTSQKESEVRVITSISADKKTLNLSKALDYGHMGESFPVDGFDPARTLHVRAEVGLLTHNIKFRGSDDTTWHVEIPECEDGYDPGEFATQTCFQGRFGSGTGADGFGAQLMFHAPVMDKKLAVGRISHTEISYSGQEFRLGRYSVHFHINGDMNGSYFRRNSIHHSFNRCVNIHGTHNLSVEYNVVYDIMGGCFFFEDGIETENTLQYNLAVFVKASTSLLNDDITPAVFWVTNPSNHINHNHVAGGTHHGFWYRLFQHPTGVSTTSEINCRTLPLGSFNNNTAHSFGRKGLWIFEVYLPKTVAIYNTLNAWHNDIGAEAVIVSLVQFNNFNAFANEHTNIEFKQVEGGSTSDMANRAAITNSFFGLYDSRLTPVIKSKFGVSIPWGDAFLMRSIYVLNCDVNPFMKTSEMQGTCTHPCGGYPYEMEDFHFINCPKKLKFRFLHEAVIIGDKTFTGKSSNGFSILPKMGILDPGKCEDAPSDFQVGVPASICQPSEKFHRFAFNKPVPNSLLYKDAVFTNTYGFTESPWSDKRVTHKEGWMVILLSGYKYKVTFKHAEHLTNLSYSGRMDSFDPTGDDKVILCHNATDKPDKFKLGGVSIDMSADMSALAGHGDWTFQEDEVCLLVASKTHEQVESRQRQLDISFFRCFFDGCIQPVDPKDALERPAKYYLWSKDADWAVFSKTKPKENEDVEIPEGSWFVVDEDIPKLKTLIIKGGMEFKNDVNISLTADYIVVIGRMVIGWDNTRIYKGNAVIELTGRRGFSPYPISDGPNVGTKALVVYGRADFFGMEPTLKWTDLSETATRGADTITVSQDVPWKKDDEIVLTTTSYSAWHTEIFKIVSVSGRTVTLNGTLKHTHTVLKKTFSDKSIDLSAKVGHFTRNIKFKGGNEDSQQFSQSFGARLLVTSTTKGEDFYRGQLMMRHVEFIYTGQEGWYDPFDPRYSVAFVDAKPSEIIGCSFQAGFSPAIGVYGTNEVTIEDNVIHHVVGGGIVTESYKTSIKGNLVTQVVATATYQNRKETKNIRWEAGIDTRLGTEVTLLNNIVAGSERAGFRHKGEECNTQSKLSGNEAHSCLVGFSTFSSEDKPISNDCVQFSNYKFWRCLDYGAYINTVASSELNDIVAVENGIGIFQFVAGPSAVGFQMADKYAKVKNATIVGQTDAFDCEVLKVDNSDDNILLTSQARGFTRSEKDKVGLVGISLVTLSGATNNSPKKPWTGIMAYNPAKGKGILEDVLFAFFGKYCQGDLRNYAISTNKGNDDMTYPTYTSGLAFIDTDRESRFYAHRPDVGKVNPSDCVDMDCDAKRKVFVSDLDGTLLDKTGTALSLVSEADYEWDGNPRHGVGDYRIPKVMLARPDGTRMNVTDIAPNKGIIRNSKCVKNTHWNAYECTDVRRAMVALQSKDADSETRRLSPVAVLIKDYVDLINGPQDHGWCAGYTCQKRLSLFHFLVELDEEAKVYFTSTSPQVLRLLILNADGNTRVLMAVYYSKRYRYDVYLNGQFIHPNNGIWDGKELKYTSATFSQCKPVISKAKHGENCFDRDNGLMYVMLKGGEPVEIRLTSQVIVGLVFMSEEEFFGENLVQNLATFLGVKESQIRIVNVVRASRRKRNAEIETRVQVECGNLPGQTGADALDHSQLQAVVTAIVNAVMLNEFPVGPGGINPLSATVTEPAPDVSSPAWGNAEPNVQPYSVSKAGRMTFYEDAVPRQEGQPFATPIRLRVYDDAGVPLEQVGTTANPWRVEATLKKGAGSHASAMLGGTTTVNFTAGWANFTDLFISHSGEDYTVEFKIVYPASNLSEETPAMTILKRELAGHLVNKTPVCFEDSPIALTLGLVDRNTLLPSSDISWRGHTWTVTASTSDITLTGTKTVAFDASTGQAEFTDLQLPEVGRYYITFTFLSNPPDFSFKHRMYIDVTNQNLENAVKEKISSCQFKFNTQYDPATSPMYVARFANKFAVLHKDKGIKIVDSTAAQGSVLATLIIEGSTTGVNNLISDLCNEVRGAEMYEFNGENIPMEPYMKVDGKDTCGTGGADGPKSGLHPGVIAAIVIAALLFVVLIVIIVVWRCYIVPKNKTYDSTRDLRTIFKGEGKYTIEDYLFRDKTFNSIKSQAPSPAAPADTSGATFSLSVDSRLDMYDDRPVSAVSNRSLPPKMPLPSD